MMLRVISVVALAVATIPLAGLSPARADETGFAEIHDWRREGAKTCMVDHFHYGQSSGHANRKLAETEAIKDWQGFTAFEYGDTWANFRLAGSKGIKCEQGGGGWGCTVEARACKAGGGAKTGKAKKN